MTIDLRILGESKRMEELYTKPGLGEHIRLHDGLFKVCHVVVTPNSCEVYATRVPKDHANHSIFKAY